MANSTLEKVRAEALNLPATDRAELAQELVAQRPASGHACFLVAETRVAMERFPEAVLDFSAFLERWRQADPQLPELKRAQAFMAGRGRYLRVVGGEAAKAPELKVVQARAKVLG